MSWPLTEDMLNERLMEQGSIALCKAIALAREGLDPNTRSTLFWRGGPSKQRDPNSRSSELTRRFEERFQHKQERALTQWTRRDPCPRCAVRMDIGCKHTRDA